ncbi:group 1 truncated hemoglobin [Paucibacter sp. AS339]|uniref:group I truncated hemoglobin n=1 Tax=Paucibacter hankyongi TaxID=3133434 RepID=UPI0030B6681D
MLAICQRLLLSFCAALALSACALMPPAASLYERLGGQAGVSALMGKTLSRAAKDARTQRSFDGIKLAPLQESLTEQLCALTGGGCKYQGQAMDLVHRDLRIAHSEFDAFVEILRQEMDASGVAAREKNELLRLLAPMKTAIVKP